MQQFVPRHMHIRRPLGKQVRGIAKREAETEHVRPRLHDHHPIGAPCHQSKVATDFPMKNKISVLNWPGDRPDLNPTQSNRQELRQAISEVWVLKIT